MGLTFSADWLEVSMIIMGALTFIYATWRWLNIHFYNISDNLNLLQQDLGHVAQQSLENYAFSHDAKIEELKGKLTHGLGLIAMVAAIAPMLGLLGTVSGMIETFQAMNMAGSSDLAVMSSGISKALYTTELGLIIAVPLVVMHALIRQKINKVVMQTEKGLINEFVVTA